MGGPWYARRSEKDAKNSSGGAAEFSWFKPPVDPGFFLCFLGMALLSSSGCYSGGYGRTRQGGARIVGNGYHNSQKPAPPGPSHPAGARCFPIDFAVRDNISGKYRFGRRIYRVGGE